MESKLNICGKEYEAKASFLTIEKFYRNFGKDFADALTNLNKQLTDLENIKETYDYIKFFGAIGVDATRLAYVMILEKDPTFKSYEDWLGELDGIFDDITWVSDVIKLGMSVFRRSLSQEA